jgi:hypothetical protein
LAQIFGKDISDTISDGWRIVTNTIRGTRVGLDVSNIGGIDELYSMGKLLIAGTVPDINYDEIVKSTVSATAITLTFKYLGSDMFYMDATNIDGDYRLRFRVATGDKLLMESEDFLLLENGDFILLEGA